MRRGENEDFLGSIVDFPIPPSENQIYANVRNVGRVKTAVAKQFEADVHAWYFTHMQHFKELKKKVWAAEKLELTIEFRFLRERVYTKSGGIKKMDVSNRLKIFIDQLFNLLEIDDSRIFRLHVVKSSLTENERTVIGFFACRDTEI